MNDGTYKTTDLYLAAVLLSKGAEFLKFERTGGLKSQVVFVLTVGNLDHIQIINDFKSNNLNGSISEFIKQFKILRASMFVELNEK